MTEAVPNYYQKFKCIAQHCKHSCCIGWEIAIDEETLEWYNSLPGEMGDAIRKHILPESGSFALDKDGRCPFLKDNGLCDIICRLGEDALCDICYLHPRFKNFYSSFTETGLGLACEEAARIVLSEKEKFALEIPEGVSLTLEEKEFFKIRQKVFDILQNRENSMKTRLNVLAEEFGLNFSSKNTASLYLSLERLDPKYTEELEVLESEDFCHDIFEDEDMQLFFENLSVYFVFRHLSEAIEDRDYASHIGFVLCSCALIGALCTHSKKSEGTLTFQRLREIVRMYSAEIEYSDENEEAVMAFSKKM